MPQKYTAADLDVLARTVFMESSGQPFAGQIGVAWVVKTRSGRPDRFGQSIAEVCLKPMQFSCWNKNEPNLRRGVMADLTQPGYAIAFSAAALVLAGERPDPTGGADHYFADYITKPDWAEKMAFTVKIGSHLFYREKS